jgi:hypothetical protein
MNIGLQGINQSFEKSNMKGNYNIWTSKWEEFYNVFELDDLKPQYFVSKQ